MTLLQSWIPESSESMPGLSITDDSASAVHKHKLNQRAKTMNESDIELLRVRLGSALIFLFKATSKYRSDEDLLRAWNAIEQASIILGPTHSESGGPQNATRQARINADIITPTGTEESYCPSTPVGQSRAYIPPAAVSAEYLLHLVTRVLSRWRVMRRPPLKPIAHLEG